MLFRSKDLFRIFAQNTEFVHTDSFSIGLRCIILVEWHSRYDCSYQQVRNWVIRYEKMGQAGLEDRRGRRIASLPSRTPEEELRDKIAELERRNLDLQMENDLLKKVRELERRGRYL